MKIPFNLHDAIDGKPVINGKGEDFQFEAYYPGTNYPVVGRIGVNREGSHYRYTKNGHTTHNEISDFDLYMKPENITRWIYVEPSLCFLTKDDALSSADRWCPKNTALIKIEYYEGENID